MRLLVVWLAEPASELPLSAADVHGVAIAALALLLFCAGVLTGRHL